MFSSSNYIAASVNTDYNEALIVLKSTERGKFQLHFLRLNDVTIHCGFFGIPLQQCTFWRQFSTIIQQLLVYQCLYSVKFKATVPKWTLRKKPSRLSFVFLLIFYLQGKNQVHNHLAKNA